MLLRIVLQLLHVLVIVVIDNLYSTSGYDNSRYSKTKNTWGIFANEFKNVIVAVLE